MEDNERKDPTKPEIPQNAKEMTFGSRTYREDEGASAAFRYEEASGSPSKRNIEKPDFVPGI